MLFTTAGASDFVSGVILFDETIRQQASDGRPLVRVLEDAGIIPGIKVDKGTTPLAKSPNELVTDGLDGLRARLAEYRELGARFAKWRAVIDIGDGHPVAVLHRRERARARPLRRAVPGRRHRPDRRARSAHGRRPLDRALLDGHDGHVAHGLRHARRAASRARRDAAQAEHGDPGQEAPGREGDPGGGRAARRSRASARSCRPRFRGSCSSRAARTTKRRPPTSTRSTRSGPHPWQVSFSYGRALQARRARRLEGRGRQRRRRARRRSCTAPT